MSKRRYLPVLLLPLAALLPHSAQGARGIDRADYHGIVSADGADLLQHRHVGWDTPPTAAAAWRAFRARHGEAWRAQWNILSGAPLRVMGAGIPAPGSTRDPAVAEATVSGILARHLDLLAPGASLHDLQLVSNELHGSMRTLGFAQYHQGWPVKDGQVSFRIKNDRVFVIGSEAWPYITINVPHEVVDTQSARLTAEHWIASATGARVRAEGRAQPMVLALPAVEGTITYHAVVEVMVEAHQPRGRWRVWLDAHTGAPVAREQILRFAATTVRFNAPERHPGAARHDYPAPVLAVQVGSNTLYSDDHGVLTWDDAQAAEATLIPAGPQVRVLSASAPLASLTTPLVNGGEVVWDQRAEPTVDAQLNAFVAASRAKEFARSLHPSLGWLDWQLRSTVNITQEACNAYSDGNTINFFAGGFGCENTARLPDVVYHEFGHSFHAQSVIPGVGSFDAALSEGGSDYFAATITGDPAMGRGFFLSDEPLRHLDPLSNARWPEDVGGPHKTGLIFGGAMWDLRKLLVQSLGETAGVAHTDALLVAVFQRASDIPSSYVEVLAADDDDGDLSNGTPNACAINKAFAMHGLADPLVALGLVAPELNGRRVRLPVAFNGATACGDIVDRAFVAYRRLGEHVSDTVRMTLEEGGFVAEVPELKGAGVLQYQVRASIKGGPIVVYPQNPVDPWYELPIGEVEQIFCHDLETNLWEEGWSHELVSGTPGEGADDWQWGMPGHVFGSGDPVQAHSGLRVVGNDLGHGNFNGTYESNKTNALVVPRIDLGGHQNVYLQYARWLTVEDGAYDQATIYANGLPVWRNRAGNGKQHHLDAQWKLHHVDLSAAAAAAGYVDLRFELAADGGMEFGGWTIDTLCVVAINDPKANPGTDPGSDPGTDPGGEPGTDPGSDPGANPGTDPGTEPGDDPGTEPGSDPGADPGSHPGTDPGDNQGTDPDSGPGDEDDVQGADFTAQGELGGCSQSGGDASWGVLALLALLGLRRRR